MTILLKRAIVQTTGDGVVDCMAENMSMNNSMAFTVH